MVSNPEWQFSQRWAQVFALDSVAAELLDSKDRELEAKLAAGYGGSCVLEFEYPYRWAQIVSEDELTQISMLTTRDAALMQAISSQGGCRLELSYQWVQMLPLMLAGDLDGFMMAEENDRIIESRFAGCSCGGISTSESFSFDGGVSEDYVFPFSGDLADWHLTALGVSANTTWRIVVRTGSTVITRFRVLMPTGGDIDATVNLNTLAITGTFPGDAVVSTTGIGSPSMASGDSFTFDVLSSSFTATPNPFELEVQFEGQSQVLIWFNPS